MASKSPTLAWCALATSCTLSFLLIAGVPIRPERAAPFEARAPASSSRAALEPDAPAPAEGEAAPGTNVAAELRGGAGLATATPAEIGGAIAGAEEAGEVAPEAATAEEGAGKRRKRRAGPRGREPVASGERALEAALDPAAALESVLAGGSASFDELVASLAALGDPAVPLLVAGLCGDPSVPMAREEEAAAGSGERHRAFREALRRMDPGTRLEGIVERASGSAPDETRVLVELLGDLDHPDAIDVLVGLSLAADPVHLRHGSLAECIETALAARIGADSQGALQLRKRLDDAPRELLEIVARACARVPTTASGAVLGSLIGRDKSLDLQLFAALARTSGEARLALPAPALDTLRRALTHPEPDFRRAAAAALGAVRDEESLAALVERIGDADERVAAAALWSLRGIARVDRGDRQGPWSEWLAEQAQWRDEHRPELLALLDSSSPEEVVKGIAGLVERPCFRGQAVPALEKLLQHEDDGVFLAAVAALEAIPTAAALDALEGVPLEPRERRSSAASAARRAFGIELEVAPRTRRKAVGR